MGTACASCNKVQRGTGEPLQTKTGPSSSQAEGSVDGSDGDRSEVAASSEDEENQEEYKQGVEEILKSTGKNLKRGKTMAMKEAISTAKKYGLETSKISEAERKLDEHKKQQKREEVEGEVEAFFNSATAGDIKQTETMLRKATDADCGQGVIKRLQTYFDELMLMRTLEEEEAQLAREYLKQSCKEFVEAATKSGGRKVTLFNLEDGQQVSASLSLDPPLENLVVLQEIDPKQQVPLKSLSAALAKDVKTVNGSEVFARLSADDRERALVVKYEANRKQGSFCFIEPTQVRRDRLREAIVILRASCR